MVLLFLIIISAAAGIQIACAQRGPPPVSHASPSGKGVDNGGKETIEIWRSGSFFYKIQSGLHPQLDAGRFA